MVVNVYINFCIYNVIAIEIKKIKKVSEIKKRSGIGKQKIQSDVTKVIGKRTEFLNIIDLNSPINSPIFGSGYISS